MPLADFFNTVTNFAFLSQQGRNDLLSDKMCNGFQDEGHTQDELRFIKRLFKAGIDLKGPHDFLAQAAWNSRHEVAALLLEHGATVTAAAFENAIVCNEKKILPLLLAAAPGFRFHVDDVKHADGIKDITPLSYALRQGYGGAVQTLLGLTPKDEIDSQDSTGMTALMLAATGNDLETVRALLSLGASVFLTNDEKRTALHYAAAGSTPEMLALLLEHKADLDARDKNGATVLHAAAVDANTRNITYLVRECKMDVDVTDNLGNTAEDYAEVIEDSDGGGHNRTIDLLRSYHNIGVTIKQRKMKEKLIKHIATGMPADEDVQAVPKIILPKRKP